ncbi:MAG: General secretory pathway protein E [Desulfotomaculum sp. 46_296]|nr:MAG: General secretory pathway protein E [Desulfotomaculum sp. 46_296]
MAVVKKRKLLGEKLIEDGLITGEQLNEALRVQARTGELLGYVLVKLGMLSEDNLNKVLGIQKIELKDEIDLNLLKTVPEQLIRKYKIFPIKKEGKYLVVAMADPLNEFSVWVRNRVDGILREVMTLPRKMAHAVVSRIKIMGSMDIAERRVPQDGRIPLRIGGKELDLRISTMPTVFGEKVVIRILDKGNIKNYTLEKLGFGPQNLEYFKKFLKNPHGIILATGPTGSGKTTTLYTALNTINSIERNIVTVEDPVEYMLEGINQTQVNIKAGATFANYLRSILRQDPDVIMIGEIRDFETAEIAVRAATTGHLVLSTMHTNDAPGAITRLIDAGIEPFMVASSVIGVVAQRLVRKICKDCRQKYTPDKAEIAFAGLEKGDIVYHGVGCDKCSYTGYSGRIAVHEVLSVSPSLQSLILQKLSNEELRKAAFMEGMITLKDDGLQKVLQGVTTIKEIIRVAFREE